MTTTIGLEQAGEELASLLRGRKAGSLEVLDVRVDVGEDRDGVPSVNLTVTLNDPDPGADTWPLDRTLDLRRTVRTRANERMLEAPVYVWFKPSTDPPQDDS